MKRITLLLLIFLLSFYQIQAQSTRNDIPVSDLPSEVETVLVEYVDILKTSADIDECAERFVSIAGGSLVNEDGKTLRSSVQPYSLTKDFNDVQHYADPIVITRVNLTQSNGSGYGASAIAGKKYKIWIDKKDKSLGVPAPISIIVPEGHDFITEPKVVGIGSL